MRATGAALALGLLVASGCEVTRVHHGRILEPPTQGESTNDHWVVIVELTSDEVLGTDVVDVGFIGDELRCEEGEALDPAALQAGTELTFVRVGDGVDTSNPPVIGGEDLRVACEAG